MFTFFDEGIEVRQTHESADIRHNLLIGDSVIQFSLKALHDITTTTELPEHVRKGQGRGINTSDPMKQIATQTGSSQSPAYRHSQVTHGFGDDVLVAHAFVGGQAVLKHSLDERHLLGITIKTELASLKVRAGLIETFTNKLWRVVSIENIKCTSHRVPQP